MNPKVSIVIPCFNSSDTISETLESALNQTWKNIEIIVIDDGSTDQSMEIISRYNEIYPKILRVYSQKRGGAARARNLGILESTGEFIQFLDSDDLLDLNKIEIQLMKIRYEEDILSFTRGKYFFDGQSIHSSAELDIEWIRRSSVFDPKDFLIKLLGGFGKEHAFFVPVHSWLVPNSLIRKAGLWDESLTVDDDGEFFSRVILESLKVIKIEENVFSYYRKYQRNKSLSSTLTKKSIYQEYMSIQKKENTFIKKKMVGIDVNRALSCQYTDLYYRAFPINLRVYRKLKHKLSIYGKSFTLQVNSVPFLVQILPWQILKLLQLIKRKF